MQTVAALRTREVTVLLLSNYGQLIAFEYTTAKYNVTVCYQFSFCLCGEIRTTRSFAVVI